METKKTIFFTFFLLLVLGSISLFISFVGGETAVGESSGDETGILDQINLLKSEGKVNLFSLEDNIVTIFLNGADSIDIGENHFENLASGEDSRSVIEMDLSGQIVRANLYNSKSSNYLINGNEFNMPENGHLSYWPDDKYYNLGEGAKVNKLSEGSSVVGSNLDLFGNLLLDGKCTSSKEGYLVSGDKVIYDKINIDFRDIYENNFLIVKDSSVDLSNYEGAWIKKVPGGLSIKGNEDGKIHLNFLEGNSLLDMSNTGLEGDKEKYFSLEIIGDNSVEIYKPSDIISGVPARINHKSDGSGITIITNGKHSFVFQGEEFVDDFQGLSNINKEAISLDITSSAIKNKVLSVDDNSRYVLHDLVTGKKLTFDTSPNGVSYKFNSEIGKEIYNFAEGELGESAFRWGGRGDVCFDKDIDTGKYIKTEVPTENRAYDCIGYAIVALTKAYPEDSLGDFPADLRLSNTLEKKGWENYIIEPSSVAGIDKTTQLVKEIPAGSIVFLMHDESFEQGTFTKGVEYAEYTNSKNEKLTLVLGHTLIRGKDKNNFLNAIPGYMPGLIPKTAEEYNSELISQNLPPYFTGTVKEGKMVPNSDYLLVMTPPSN